MDLLGDGGLGADGINGHGAALQFQGGQQPGDGLDLVALFRAQDLPGAQGTLIHPGAQQMHQVPS